jgi:hypothetical protein
MSAPKTLFGVHAQVSYMYIYAMVRVLIDNITHAFVALSDSDSLLGLQLRGLLNVISVSRICMSSELLRKIQLRFNEVSSIAGVCPVAVCASGLGTCIRNIHSFSNDPPPSSPHLSSVRYEHGHIPHHMQSAHAKCRNKDNTGVKKCRGLETPQALS